MPEAMVISEINAFALNPELKEFHSNCRRWLSEVGFWRDELNFLFKASQQVVCNVKNKDEAIKLRFLTGKIVGELPIELTYLKDKIEQIQELLATSIKHPYILEQQRLISEYKFLKTRVRTFREQFRNVKRDLFQLAKNQEDIS